MGSCFSRSEFDHPLPVAKVISMNGELHEYAFPVTVSRVLHLEVAAPPISSSSGFFVCDSDRLYYEECIPALAPGEELVGDQIYFVLPESRLNQRLTPPEMAALAVKASLALQLAEEKRCGRHRRRRKASVRISPVVEVTDRGRYDGFVTNDGYGRAIVNERGRSASNMRANGRVTISGSFRKRAMVSYSKRGKIAVGSSRVRLGTIYEGDVN